MVQQQQPPHSVPERLLSEGNFEPSQVESVLLKWVGHNVVLKYLGGPDEPIDQQDPKGLARGPLEARSGLFYLAKYGQAGLEVARGLEDARSERVTLIP